MLTPPYRGMHIFRSSLRLGGMLRRRTAVGKQQQGKESKEALAVVTVHLPGSRIIQESLLWALVPSSQIRCTLTVDSIIPWAVILDRIKVRR